MQWVCQVELDKISWTFSIRHHTETEVDMLKSIFGKQHLDVQHKLHKIQTDREYLLHFRGGEGVQRVGFGPGDYS